MSLGTTSVATSAAISDDKTSGSASVADVPKVNTETAVGNQTADNVMSTADSEPKVTTESSVVQPAEAKDETSNARVTEDNTVDVAKQAGQQVEEVTPVTTVTPATTDVTVTKVNETDTTQQTKAPVVNTEEQEKVQTPVATTQTIATVADSKEIIDFRKQLAAKGYVVLGYGEPDDKVWLGNIVIGDVMYENVVTVGVMQLDDQTNAMLSAYDNEWFGKITVSAQTKQYNNVINYVDDDAEK